MVFISLTFRILQNRVQYSLTAAFSHSYIHLRDEPELRELDAPELRLEELLELLRLGVLTLLLLRLGVLTLLLRLLLELELELRLVLALELRLELVLELLRVALLPELLRLLLDVAELLRLELVELELLRVELEVAELLRVLLLVALLRSLLTLRDAAVFSLLALRELLALLSVRLGLVLLGRSYVVPDCADLEAEVPDEREELERLEVAGATFLTDELLVDCVALRELPVVLREAFVVALREVVAVALREADAAVVLREAAVLTLRSVVPADLPDALDAVTLDERVALRLAVADAERVALRLRFLSHPPPLTLRLGT